MENLVKCKHCNGEGQYLVSCKPQIKIDEETIEMVWAFKQHCQWCMGTGKHIPLSEDLYI